MKPTECCLNSLNDVHFSKGPVEAMELSEDALEALLRDSRHDPTSALQQAPSVLQTADKCLQQLGSHPPDSAAPTCHLLLQALRVLRNLCALGGPAACEEILQGGALDAVGRLLDMIERAVIQLDWQLPLVGAQLLANASAAGPACAAAVWLGAFPRRLNTLAHINSGPAQSALSLCLLTCCRKVPGAAEALCSPDGAPILAAVLCGQQRLPEEGQQSNDSLGLLLSFLCFQRGLLPSLASSLASPLSNYGNSTIIPPGAAASSEAAAQPQAGAAAAVGPAAKAVAASPSLAHVLLLQELSCEAQLEGHLAFEGGAAEGGALPMQFLVDLVQELALAAKRGPLAEGQQQVLHDALQLMRDIAGNEDASASAPSATSQRPSLVLELCQAGMLLLLLAMLRALPPIRSPRHPQHGSPSSGWQNDGASGSAGPLEQGLPIAELAPGLAERAKQLPSQPPYFGYRTDLLSVLANAAFGRPAVKAEIQALGGVELVLSQCQMDGESPLAREWALWAVRNLCEGNEAAQAAIRELQLCTAVETEEARQLGVKVELDRDTGKLRVVQQQPAQQQHQQQ